MNRDFQDEQGCGWQALAVEEVVAHGKIGRRLAFRPADEPDAPPLLSNITFNSHQAADFALRTLGVKELRRRLTLSEAAVGGV